MDCPINTYGKSPGFFSLFFCIKPHPSPSLSEIRSAQNLQYDLRKNLFLPDGKQKVRCGGKPQGTYSLEDHLSKIKDKAAKELFIRVREFLLSLQPPLKEEYRKHQIIYINEGLYNAFMIICKKRHIWLAVRGRIQAPGWHTYFDGILTFVKMVPKNDVFRHFQSLISENYRALN